VPDDYPKKWACGHYRTKGDFWATLPPPTHPREGFDLQEYLGRVEIAKQASKDRGDYSDRPASIREPKIRVPEPEFLPESKPTGFKLKFGKLN
jgi:hypothetical protein